MLHGLDVRPIDRFEADMDELGLRAADGYGSHFSRDAEYFNWRYLDSPRDYRCFGAYRAGRARGRRGRRPYVQARRLGGISRRSRRSSRGQSRRFALSSPEPWTRSTGGADALVLLPPPSSAQRRALIRAGFAPTNKKLRFIGKALHDGVRIDERADAWHFTLGDFDFF